MLLLLSKMFLPTSRSSTPANPLGPGQNPSSQNASPFLPPLRGLPQLCLHTSGATSCTLTSVPIGCIPVVFLRAVLPPVFAGQGTTCCLCHFLQLYSKNSLYCRGRKLLSSSLGSLTGLRIKLTEDGLRGEKHVSFHTYA